MFNPRVRKISWRRKWQPTLVFLPGKSHGQRSLASYGHRRVRHDLATKQQQQQQKRQGDLGEVGNPEPAGTVPSEAAFTCVSHCPEITIICLRLDGSVPKSCLTLCYPMDCSLPGSSVHGIFQARILEWVAISFSKESSRPRDRTHVSDVSCIAGGSFTH